MAAASSLSDEEAASLCVSLLMCPRSALPALPVCAWAARLGPCWPCTAPAVAILELLPSQPSCFHALASARLVRAC